jgi:hypothetical protein
MKASTHIAYTLQGWFGMLGGMALFCAPWPLFMLPYSLFCSPALIPAPVHTPYHPCCCHSHLAYVHPPAPTAIAAAVAALQLLLSLPLLLQLQLSGFIPHCCHCCLAYTRPAAPAADAAAAAVAALQLLLSLLPLPSLCTLCLYMPFFIHLGSSTLWVVWGCSRSYTHSFIHSGSSTLRVVLGCSCSLAPQFNACNTLVFVYLLCTYLLSIILETPLVPETCKRLA